MSFIDNAWYVAALPEEVQDKPLSRKILGEHMVLFRGEDGAPAALLDICPHRFAPLSMGLVTDGIIQCPYHGLEFDRAGTCVKNPHGTGARPASLNIRSFPTVERDALIWIWMGETQAEEDLIPDFSFRTDPSRTTIGGHARVDASYRLLVDNLMDLSHAQFLHGANVASDAFENIKRECFTEGRSICQNLTIPNSSVTRLHAPLFDDPAQRIDFFSDISWHPVTAMSNMIGVVAAGGAKADSYNSCGTHIITPETGSSCHYFYASSRNYAIDDLSQDKAIVNWQRQALMAEDKPVAEAIEERRDAVSRHGMRQAMLSIDEAAVRVSRELDRLTAEATRKVGSDIREHTAA